MQKERNTAPPPPPPKPLQYARQPLEEAKPRKARSTLTMRSAGVLHKHLLLLQKSRRPLLSSSSCFFTTASSFFPHKQLVTIKTLQNPKTLHFYFPAICLQQPALFVIDFPPSLSLRLLSTTNNTRKSKIVNDSEDGLIQHETTEDIETDGWEEEEEMEPKLGDGGDGGGVVLQGVPWGERALAIAHEVLMQFGNEMKLFSFKTTPRGYVYVRLDNLSQKYGCPSMEELESYNQEYVKRLEEVRALGEIPDNLAVEVSSPGAERLLNVPRDLSRFQDVPMRVCYVEDVESNGQEKNGVFFLESMEMESENCIWKLADVKENRDPQSKGRPLSRKRRDWRLKLPFEKHTRVTLYLEF